MKTKNVDLIEEYVKLRNDKKALKEQISDITSRMDEIGASFLDYFKREDCERATFRGYTVYSSKSIVPSMKDWDKFWAYCRKNNLSHLVERRASVTGCRELFATKGKIPGVEPFERITIGVLKT